ncbi:hypothetical protein V6N13_091108 [Hibiscus sabdariffa]
MVDSAGDWRWSRLQNQLPQQILLWLAAIQRPKYSFPMDSRNGARWLLEVNGWPILRLQLQYRCDSSRPEWLRNTKGGSFTIIYSIHLLCDLDWRLVFSKVARSNNGVPDSLTKLALSDTFDIMFYEDPPIGMVLD